MRYVRSVEDVIEVNDLDLVLAALDRPRLEPTNAGPSARRTVFAVTVQAAERIATEKPAPPA